MTTKTEPLDYFGRFVEVNHFRFSKLQEKAQGTSSGREILEQCLNIAELLIEKNKAYGDSALNPIRCFSKADTSEQLRVRLDDKFSRLLRGSHGGEDVVLDLIGYLVLLRIAESRTNGQVQDRHREGHHGSLRARGGDRAGSSREAGEEPAGAGEDEQRASSGGDSSSTETPSGSDVIDPPHAVSVDELVEHGVLTREFADYIRRFMPELKFVEGHPPEYLPYVQETPLQYIKGHIPPQGVILCQECASIYRWPGHGVCTLCFERKRHGNTATREGKMAERSSEGIG